jgi:cell division protein YceG involved in septum cleavage
MSRKKQKGINIMVSTAVAIALRVIIYSLILVAIVKGSQTAYNFGHEIFYISSVDEAPGRDVKLRIPSGSSAEDVAEMLEDQGLIKNKASFYVQAWFFQYDITPGTYTLNTSMTPRQMLEIIDTGPEGDESSRIEDNTAKSRCLS